MVVEFARNVASMDNANTTEVDVRTPYPVIALMDDQVDITNKGGTMRLGAWEARLRPGSQVAALYGDVVASERHRHRFEVNPRFRGRLEEAGLVCSGIAVKDDRLVEYIELPSHPFWVATQAHPEFKSRPDRAHPLFSGLVAAAVARARSRQPRLLELDLDIDAIA
jgi:CTP synthase